MNKPEGFEFRSANDNEMAELQRLGNYVFASPPSENDPPQLLAPDWTHCAFQKDKLAAISGAYPFIVRLNGKTTQMHGVTMVGTEPEFRRRGLVRQLITDLLHRGKEAGDVASILLASKGAIYQRFGYGIASNHVMYEFDPREAGFQFDIPANGRLERLGKDAALPLIKRIHKSYARERNMMALRSDPVWNIFVSDMEKHKAFCTVHFDEQNQPDGYCIYSTKWEPGKDQELMIRDFAYTTMSAYRAIWQNICAHDLVRKVTWDNVPEDDPAPGILLEPRCLNRKTGDGLWLRVIDVAAALEARRYDIDGDITIELQGDDICPWNNGGYRLSTRRGVGKVESANIGDADISCAPNALASLLAGYASIAWLHQIGRLTVQDPTQTGYFDQLFTARHRPSMSFGF